MACLTNVGACLTGLMFRGSTLLLCLLFFWNNLYD